MAILPIARGAGDPSSIAAAGAFGFCPRAACAAYGFIIGANTLSASATDHAGNEAGATASFTVQVTTGGVGALTTRFVSRAGIAGAMVRQLENGAIRAHVNHVRAQSGKSLSAEHAVILIRLAGQLQAPARQARLPRARERGVEPGGSTPVS